MLTPEGYLEAVNLAIMKLVQSRIKLEQMIGRGTRSQAVRRPALYHLVFPNVVRKTEFLVIDFWDNRFNRMVEEVTAQELPILTSLFSAYRV